MQYKTQKNIIRKPKKTISYKINKEMVKTKLNIIDNKEQINMKQKYNDFHITRLHLGRIIRSNN